MGSGTGLRLREEDVKLIVFLVFNFVRVLDNCIKIEAKV